MATAKIDIQTNASQVTQDVEKLKNSLVGASFTPSMAQGAPYSQDFQPVGSSELNGTENTNTDQIRNQTEETKKQTDLLKSLLDFIRNNFRKTNESNELTSAERKEIALREREGSKDIQSANNFVNGTAQTVGQMMNGDTFGWMQRGFRGASNFLENKSIQAKGNGADGLASGLAAAGIIGAIAAAGSGLANQAVSQYTDLLPGTEDFYRAFGGDISGKSADYNAAYAQKKFNQYQSMAEGTGLSNREFFQTASEFGRYQIKNEIDALNMTRSAANYARYTGGDISAYQDMIGTSYRYNKESGDQTLKNALAGTIASGLDKNGMPEFLAGMQQVVQRGISAGFKDSTKDVADNLSFLSQLNGGDALWSGEQGVNRYITMANGISGATALNNSTQLLAYQAASRVASSMSEAELSKTLGNAYIQGAGSLNTMALMEKNPNAEMFKAIAENINSAYGGDVQGQVYAYKELYGLNTSGSMELVNAFQKLQNGEIEIKDFDEIMKSVTENVEYKNDSTKQIDATNKVQQAVADVGKKMMSIKTGSLDSIGKTTSSIYSFLVKDSYKDLTSSAFIGTTDNPTDSQGLAKIYSNLINNPKTMDAAMQVVEGFGSFTDEQKEKLKKSNWLKDYDENKIAENPTLLLEMANSAIDNYEINKKAINARAHARINAYNDEDAIIQGNGFNGTKYRTIKNLYKDNKNNTDFISAMTQAFDDERVSRQYENKLPDIQRSSFMTTSEYLAARNGITNPKELKKIDDEYAKSMIELLKAIRDKTFTAVFEE